MDDINIGSVHKPVQQTNADNQKQEAKGQAKQEENQENLQTLYNDLIALEVMGRVLGYKMPKWLHVPKLKIKDPDPIPEPRPIPDARPIPETRQTFETTPEIPDGRTFEGTPEIPAGRTFEGTPSIPDGQTFEGTPQIPEAQPIKSVEIPPPQSLESDSEN